MIFPAILQRLRYDFRLSSNEGHYEYLLRRATDAGYRIRSLTEAHTALEQSELAQPLFALRHDVDIPNHPGNRMFYRTERRLGLRSTFYFRIFSWRSNRRLIADLRDNGFEVGYHYEEGATVAMLRGARSRADVFRYEADIRDLFRRNCEQFRRSVCADLTSVCSHGDWINRKLSFSNAEFINNRLLSELGISFEAYDFAERADRYVSDTGDYKIPINDPNHWKNRCLPESVINARPWVVCMLTHDRNWHPGWFGNLRSSWLVSRQRLAWQYGIGRPPILSFPAQT